MPYFLTKQETQQAIKLYLDGKSSTEIAAQFNKTTCAITHMLARNNIATRNISKCQQKYNINEYAFDDLSNDCVNYWIGMLMSDGSIVHKKKFHCIRLSLQEQDRNHVYKFRSFLRSSHKIVKTQKQLKGKTYYGYRLQIYNKSLCETLTSYGVVPQKSLIAKFNNNIINIYNKHLWRGMIDGDGCISVARQSKNNNKTYPHIELCGSYNNCKDFQLFCIKTLNLNNIKLPKSKIVKHANIYKYRFQGPPAYHIIKHLYTNHDISLDRKQKKADEILLRFKDKYE